MFKKIILLGWLLPVIACADVLIPDAIKVPVGHDVLLSVHAKGDQIYHCVLHNSAYSWQTQAPDARLFDAQGQIVGKHYAGPVWEYKAGSRVEGRIVKTIDSPLSTAIAWLLVEVVGHKGNDLFAQARFINRINTQGGLPPLKACDTNHLGREQRVNYSADYIFYQ